MFKEAEHATAAFNAKTDAVVHAEAIWRAVSV